MDKIQVHTRGVYSPREPMAVADGYTLRFNVAASGLLAGMEKVDAYMDGMEIVLKAGKDMYVRHYATGDRIHSRDLVETMGYGRWDVSRRGEEVRLCRRR